MAQRRLRSNHPGSVLRAGRRPWRQIFLVTLAAGLAVMPARAVLVTWDFVGTYKSGTYIPAPGSTVTGTMTFDDNPTFVDGSYGDKYFAMTSLVFTVNGYTSSLNPPTSPSVTFTVTNPFMTIYNDFNGNQDIVNISGGLSYSGNPSNPFTDVIMSLSAGSSKIATHRDFLTSGAPVGWTSGMDLNWGSGRSINSDSYNLTSFTAVPEPGPVLLVGLGLGMVAFLRKRRA